VNIIASGNDINAKSKYKVSTNPPTGLYYRLHILDVEMSDIKKYRCSRLVNTGVLPLNMGTSRKERMGK
jgi:hypothetical protein